MMPGAYRIVPYDPGLREAVLRMEAQLWTKDPARNAAYFAWKYERNPYLPGPVMRVALYGTEVVGVRGLFGAAWESDAAGTPVLMPCVADSVIAEAHRSRGLLTELTQAVLEDGAGLGARHVLNLSAGPAMFVASLAAGWRSAGDLGPWQRLGPGEAWARRVRRRFAGHPRATAAVRRLWHGVQAVQMRLGHAGRPRHRGGMPSLAGSDVGEITVEERPRVDAMADLMARVGSDGRLRHVRDERYFAWRFGNPRARYQFVYRGSRTIDAYLVLRWGARGQRAGADVVAWEGTDAAACGDVLRAGADLAGRASLGVWSATLSADRLQALCAAGFEPYVRPSSVAAPRPALLVMPVGDRQASGAWSVGERSVLDLANWDLRGLDSDAA